MLPESVKRPTTKRVRPEPMSASVARLFQQQAGPRRADVDVDLARFADAVAAADCLPEGEPGGLADAVATAVARTRGALGADELADVRATLEVIRAEADAASRVIAQLGDMVRADREAPPFVRLVGLNDLVIEALGSLGARARLGAGLGVVLDRTLPSVAGDPDRLREAIHALLVAPMRAREAASSPGGITVRTSHGPGVLRGDRVVRIDVAGEARPAGDGALEVERWPDPALRLSVYLASRIAHQHGGVLTATAPAGGGLTLSFELPAV